MFQDYFKLNDVDDPKFVMKINKKHVFLLEICLILTSKEA